jgi:hypothetical protein
MKRLLMVAVMLITVACGEKSPTNPTREVPVKDTSTHAEDVHLNTAVRMYPSGQVAFVCKDNGSSHTLADGTVVKVKHMLSKVPCDAYGVGQPFVVR